MNAQLLARAAVCLQATPLVAAAPALAARRAADEALPAGPDVAVVDAASKTMSLVILVLVALILLPVAFFVYRKLFGAVAAAPATAPAVADSVVDAQAEEARGNHAAAAARYEAAGEKLRAGAAWERAKDLSRAAECFEAAGDLDRAAQLHLRSGGALRAAGIYMQTKNYIEAAKIFRNKGDHLRAAQALELFGNRVAAAREYSAAGEYVRAAGMFEKERMYVEAAEAYRPLLGDGPVTAQGADHHATHAALLERAGDRAGAAEGYRRVLAVVPGHPRAASGLLRLQPGPPVGPAPATATRRPLSPEPAAAAGAAPRPPGAAPDELECELLEEPTATPAPAPVPAAAPADAVLAGELGSLADDVDPLKRVFRLRSMIHAGRMDPRYSMRLWVQVMRALAERHAANQVLGCVTPDSITVDMQNDVRVEADPKRPAAYLSPEVQAGLPPDRQADIYAMGVVLYELVTGSTESLGKKRAGELYSDVPPWLDELIERCTEKNLTKRFRTTEEVSAALVRLKSTS